jgi:DtxR family transcriptional regulator, Mn-dependent transcriptional regulator
MKNISSNTQDYLKTIYALVSEEGEASTMEIARRLEIAPASVTGMLQRMAVSDPPLVNYHKGQGATLTAFGEREALQVIRHHRLLETYLVRALGYSWDTVHEEACRLEHVISEDFEQRIAQALGDPLRDPHGEPIPTQALVMMADSLLPLAKLRPTQRAVVVRVQADDQSLLRHLQKHGLTPGANLEVRDYAPFDENLTLSVEGGKEIVVGLPVSSRIFVEVI